MAVHELGRLLKMFCLCIDELFKNFLPHVVRKLLIPLYEPWYATLSTKILSATHWILVVAIVSTGSRGLLNTKKKLIFLKNVNWSHVVVSNYISFQLSFYWHEKGFFTVSFSSCQARSPFLYQPGLYKSCIFDRRL